MSGVHECRHRACFFCKAAWAGISQLLSLSIREVEILQCLLLGDDEREAAAFLGLTARTARTHIERIHAKLGVHTRAALMVRLFDARVPLAPPVLRLPWRPIY